MWFWGWGFGCVHNSCIFVSQSDYPQVLLPFNSPINRWTKYYDGESDPPSEYWYNETSGEVFYEDGSTAEVTYSEPEASQDAGDWAGWEEVWDDVSEAYYWYNSETQETYWDEE